MSDGTPHDGTESRQDDALVRARLRGKALPRGKDREDIEVEAFIFDEDGRALGRCDLDAEGVRLELPESLKGRMLTIALAPPRPEGRKVTLAGLENRGALVVRAPFVDPGRAIDLGKFRVPWRRTRSCCRVRGRVVREIRLPDGREIRRPLCNARVVICEVDRKPAHVIARLPDDLLWRLADELVEIGVPLPLPQPDPPPIDPAHWSVAMLEAGPAFTEGAPPGHRVPLFGTAGHHVETSEDEAGTDRKRAGEGSPEDVTVARAGGPAATTALRTNRLREVVLANLDIVKDLWCRFHWLHSSYELDCLRKVVLGPDGTFDTHIEYDCFGDKPDLYFKVEQRCAGAWETVHAPSIPCTTRWDYCCGEEVEIVVTRNVGLGPVLDARAHVYEADDPASIGEWTTLPYDSQVFVVHAAVMWTGKVLLFSGGVEHQLPLESRVWDPVAQTFQTHTFADDLFCAFQNVLPDGRVLVMGGSNYNGPHGRGIDVSYTFDPGSPGWTKHADMAFGRWYPTGVVMPDGTVPTMSGRPQSGGPVPEIEVFDPNTDTWSTLPSSANKTLDIYPSLHLMHDGKVFYSGTRWAGGTSSPRPWSPPDTALFDASTNSWTDVGPHVIPNRTEGTSVLLPPRGTAMHHHGHGEEMPPPGTTSRVLVLGGDCGNPSERVSAEVIDLADPAPAWTRIADMHHRRVNPNAVLLPDGEVLVCAGINGFKWDPDPGRVLESELFDPQAMTWRRAGVMSIGRQYHSISVLLPDGRVLNAGSVGGTGGQTNLLAMEVFSPPYLFRGPRPRISSYPTSAAHGSTIRVATPDACRVRRAAFVRPGAPTHHTDSDQRFVPVDFHREGRCDLMIPVPPSAAVMPPGYYMLFILDDCGVPSVGKFIRIGPEGGPV